MIKSPQTAVRLATNNPYQSDACRILCVCSVGMLRSPTLANELHKRYGYNTRSCGVSMEHALVPISTALIHWADEIVFMDFGAFNEFVDIEENMELIKKVKNASTDVFILSIPDEYDWNDPKLRDISVMQYLEKRKFNDME